MLIVAHISLKQLIIELRNLILFLRKSLRITLQPLFIFSQFIGNLVNCRKVSFRRCHYIYLFVLGDGTQTLSLMDSIN